MGVVRRTLGSLSPKYTIRAYVIAFALFAFMVWMLTSAPPAQGELASSGQNSVPYAMLVYLFVCSLLFPFAKLVWDELRDMALGNNFVLINAFVMLTAKVFINLLLWFFALFVAPLGMLYVWYRTREAEAS